MSESELNEIFAVRLKTLMDIFAITQTELAKRIGVGTSTISHWCRAERTPRADALEKLCDVFNCSVDDLITEKTQQQYYEAKTGEIAQKIAGNPKLRMLMDAAADMDPEKLEHIHNYLLFLKNQELHLDDD